eukprot:20062-Heterococcus_DN1.PRE.2
MPWALAPVWMFTQPASYGLSLLPPLDSAASGFAASEDLAFAAVASENPSDGSADVQQIPTAIITTPCKRGASLLL